MTTVLVTGGTGFLAGWTIRRLLEKSYTVRTTVRSMAKADSVRNMLAKEHVDTSALSFAVADLTKADGWDAAMEGIDYVLHVASPLGGNNHEDPTLIPTAKEGVEHVFSAAIKAGVKKIVMTSSEAANYPDKKDTNPAVNEDFWTDLNNKWITNYQRSKVIAESEEMTMPEMARILKEAYPNRKISTIVIPDFVISVMAKFQVPMKVLNTMVGLKYYRDNTKARKLLGWTPRPAKETVLDTAQYLIDYKIV